MFDFLRKPHTLENGWWTCNRCGVEIDLVKGNYDANIFRAKAHYDEHWARLASDPNHKFDSRCLCQKCWGTFQRSVTPVNGVVDMEAFNEVAKHFQESKNDK
jgi:hypothetical protein